MPASQPNNSIGLVLQGGGARGAYQAGALKAIAEIDESERNPFPIIAGASVGAINAAALAANCTDFPDATARLEGLWRSLRSDSVYDTRPTAIAGTSARWLWTIVAGGFGIADPCALLDNAPLRKLLGERFRREGIALAIRDGALDAVCVTAASYDRGRSVSFFEAREGIAEWQRARRDGVWSRITTDHLMASSALPFVFKPVRMKDGFYGDGALRLTSPLSPAIRLGAQKLMVIGVRDNTPDPEGGGTDATFPSIGEMSGHALDILFNDNLDADVERLSRINRTLTLFPPEARGRTGLRIIDVLTLNPSIDLRDLAQEHAHEMPRTIRLLMRSLGAWGRDSRLVSYLLFEPGFISALIDLGYQDTMARADEVRGFLAS